MTPIILASTSAARAGLLRATGAPFSVASPRVDEEAAKTRLVADGFDPKAVAKSLAAMKAVAVSNHRPGLVIGADQTLEFEGSLFDKPGGLDEARDRLLMLRGRVHTLHAAVCVARDGIPQWSEVSSPRLTMRDFSDSFLQTYLEQAGSALLSSVGGYYLEGQGAQLFDQIEGDYFAILGLPLLGVLACLRRFGGLAP